MKRKRFFSSIAFVLSLVMLAVSGAVLVHTAQQQSVSTSLSVTFSGENVDFTANGWYQVKNTASHPYLVNGNGTEGITIHATDASTTTSLSTPANTSVELTASNTYVLFTYKFTNTASNGAFGMNVSLTGSSPLDNNIDVKYLVSSANATDYYSSSATDEAKISALDEKVSAVTGTTAFSNVFIQAGHHKYFYILVSLKDNTLSGTYNNTLSWNVVCSDKTEEATVSIRFNSNNKTISTAVVIFDDDIAVYKATGSGEINDTFYVGQNSTIKVRYGSDYVSVNLGDNINSNAVSGSHSTHIVGMVDEGADDPPIPIFRIGMNPYYGNFDFVANANIVIVLLQNNI